MTTTDETVRTAVTVVGIPCRNEAATVAAVAGVADSGLASVCPTAASRHCPHGLRGPFYETVARAPSGVSM
jgi:hypothetical protein